MAEEGKANTHLVVIRRMRSTYEVSKTIVNDAVKVVYTHYGSKLIFIEKANGQVVCFNQKDIIEIHVAKDVEIMLVNDENTSFIFPREDRLGGVYHE